VVYYFTHNCLTPIFGVFAFPVASILVFLQTASLAEACSGLCRSQSKIDETKFCRLIHHPFSNLN